MLAAFLGFDHFEPFTLDLRASGRAAHHTKAVVNEPDHVIEEAFAVFAFLQPGFDFLCPVRAMMRLPCPCSKKMTNE